MTDVNDFLLASGVPSAKFPTPGTIVKGTVISSALAQQTKLGSNEGLVWEDGSPRMQVVVTLQTDERDAAIEDDDGKRRLFVKANMQKAVSEALRSAGAKLEVGGTLAVQYVSDGKSDKPGFNPPKLYAAQYKPPAAQPGGDLLGDTAPPVGQPSPADLIS